MEILGIGPLEFAVIILIMFIVLGPDQMVKTARMFGRVIYKIRKSNLWKEISNLRTLPQTLVDQAGLDEIKEMNKTIKNVNRDLNAWTTPLSTQSAPPLKTQIGDISDEKANPVDQEKPRISSLGSWGELTDKTQEVETQETTTQQLAELKNQDPSPSLAENDTKTTPDEN